MLAVEEAGTDLTDRTVRSSSVSVSGSLSVNGLPVTGDIPSPRQISSYVIAEYLNQRRN